MIGGGEPIAERASSSTRPWQHVLEPLGGYLLLAERLHTDPRLATAFNFGPERSANRCVAELVEEILRGWPGTWIDRSDPLARHEAGRLDLSTDRNFHCLSGSPHWYFERTIAETVGWYQRHLNGDEARALCLEQIERATCEADKVINDRRFESGMPNSEPSPTAAGMEAMRAEILSLTHHYARSVHRAFRPADDPLTPCFDPESGSIPYAGRVFTEDEVEAAVKSTLDFWLTLGKEGEAFQQELADFLGVRACLAVNSGSSANLLALSALTSPLLPEARRLHLGDEVITCAAGFPTTVTPILQNGCVPVFVDNDPITGNLRADQLEAAFTPGRTKAVMAAHALGNPFDLGSVLAFCRRHDLWLIEDNCDALGCSYTLPRAQAEALGFSENSPGLNAGPGHIIRWTGTWGDLSTQSFYPPHHLTMGEWGAVNIVASALLGHIVESFRDWGCCYWCPSGHDNTCAKRYDWQLGELPKGNDHKYNYSRFVYNLKPLDPQAAIGRVQLRRLPQCIEARKRNWLYLRRALEPLSDVFSLCLPSHAKSFEPSSGSFAWDNSGARSDCSRFGFLLLVRPEAPFTSSDLGRHLAAKGVGTRMLFGGNLLRQPAFMKLLEERPDAMRITVAQMAGADQLLRQAIFLGTYPGLSEAIIDHEVALIHAFVKERRRSTGSEAVAHRSLRAKRPVSLHANAKFGLSWVSPAPSLQANQKPGINCSTAELSESATRNRFTSFSVRFRPESHRQRKCPDLVLGKLCATGSSEGIRQ